MLLLLCTLQIASSVQPVQRLVSPAPFHSVGFELQVGFQSAEIAILGPDGTAGPWWPVVKSADLSHGQLGGKQFSALVHGSSSASVGLLLRGPQASTTALKVIWIAASAPSRSTAAAMSDATSWSSTSGPPLSIHTPPAATTRPPIYSRASWGANPPTCSPSYCNTTHIAMHHTASASEYASTSWSQCASNVKATQVYHMVTRGWCDMGYNYLICPHGDIFEGRGGGDDVRGAHDGFNCGSMGVAMMGYFHAPYSQTLNAAMENAFVDLAAWKCAQQTIDPLGSSWYAGFGAVQQNLYGHRDVSSTACPGDFAYAELPQLRARVDSALNGSGTEIILDNGAATYFGSWTTSSSAAGHYGPDYRWASTGVAAARALWTPNIPSAGNYQVSMWWPAGSNRNPATLVGVELSSGIRTATINQQTNGGQWNVLGNIQLPAGAVTTFGLSNAGANGFVVIADALRLIKL